MTSEVEKLNSMNLLVCMVPMAALLLLLVSLYVEGNIVTTTLAKAATIHHCFLFLLGNVTVAYLVNLTNFLVTKHISTLTVQVLGNAKVAVAAIVYVLIFKNPVMVMGIAGFGINLSGVVLYNEAKKRTRSHQSSLFPSSNSSDISASSPSH